MSDPSPAPSLEQLQSQARRLAFFLIEMTPTDAWAPASAARRKALLREHLLWQAEQEREGRLLLAGPVDHDLTEGHGLAVIRARSREEAEQLAATEPFVREGLRANTVRSWTVNEGSITVSIQLFNGQAELR